MFTGSPASGAGSRLASTSRPASASPSLISDLGSELAATPVAVSSSLQLSSFARRRLAIFWRRNLRSDALRFRDERRRRSAERREDVSRSLECVWSIRDCFDWSSDLKEDDVSLRRLDIA